MCRPRGCDSRPGRRVRANRLRHLLTICRGVSSRDAMTSLDRPSSASRTILARTTSQYGEVYLRAIASRARRSSRERLIAYGLFLGIRALYTSNASVSGCAFDSQKKTNDADPISDQIVSNTFLKKNLMAKRGVDVFMSSNT